MRFFIAAGRVFFFLSAVLLFIGSAYSQPSLRRQMDFDNDAKADLAIFRPSDSKWWILKSNGGFTTQAFGIANTDFMTPGQFDNDGKADIAVWRDTTGQWFWLNSSNFTMNIRIWGTTGDEPVARDYDGDGRTDLAVVRRSGGIMTWWILQSTGGFRQINWGNSTDFTAPGDFNGDGFFDLGVQRPGPSATSPATFFIFQPVTSSFSTIQFGQSNDLVVPGDYDLDGKTDIAVVREGDTPDDFLTWFVRRSTNGTTYSRAWGVTGTDLLVQNDYDGDGRTELAIWRNTDGRFWILNIQTNVVTTRAWGQPNDLPIASFDTH
jgi:hypothetical protein